MWRDAWSGGYLTPADRPGVEQLARMVDDRAELTARIGDQLVVRGSRGQDAPTHCSGSAPAWTPRCARRWIATGCRRSAAAGWGVEVQLPEPPKTAMDHLLDSRSGHRDGSTTHKEKHHG